MGRRPWSRWARDKRDRVLPRCPPLPPDYASVGRGGEGARQVRGLSGCRPKGNGVTLPVGGHARFGAVAATRAARRVAILPLGHGFPLLAASIAFGWTRACAPSGEPFPRGTSRSCTRPSSRSRTPARDHRRKICAGSLPEPRSSRTARHLAPFRCRRRMAGSVHRRSCGGVLALARPASTRGTAFRPRRIAQHRPSRLGAARTRAKPIR